MKSKIEKIKIAIVFFILGLVLSSGLVYAVTLYQAKEVAYDNSNSGSNSTDVQSAIDELYEMASDSCDKVAIPNLGTDLIPVTIADDGTVTYADTSKEWYNYCDKIWANAIDLIDSPSKSYKVGDTISESDIRSYFVWIPKYKYKLWNVGTTNPTKLAHSIEIIFDTTNTTNIEGVSCEAPMASGERGECDNGEYMTHPAFISMDVDGFWVGKFETTGSISNITIKPNITSLRNQTLYNMFVNAYNYSRENDSHMMKNTEWGAVAYLSHSKYGIGTEVNINNNSSFITGSSSLITLNQSVYPGKYGTGSSYNESYNTEVGYLASTTGDISGIYDMSGRTHEYMASYVSGNYGSSGFNTTNIQNYDSKYFDIYLSNSSETSYQNRILGDATGEMGPFINYEDSDGDSRYHSKWFSDFSVFLISSDPWFRRGGHYNNGVLAGQFYFYRESGASANDSSFRLVLSPKN